MKPFIIAILLAPIVFLVSLLATAQVGVVPPAAQSVQVLP